MYIKENLPFVSEGSTAHLNSTLSPSVTVADLGNVLNPGRLSSFGTATIIMLLTCLIQKFLRIKLS